MQAQSPVRKQTWQTQRSISHRMSCCAPTRVCCAAASSLASVRAREKRCCQHATFQHSGRQNACQCGASVRTFVYASANKIATRGSTSCGMTDEFANGFHEICRSPFSLRMVAPSRWQTRSMMRDFHSARNDVSTSMMSSSSAVMPYFFEIVSRKFVRKAGAGAKTRAKYLKSTRASDTSS
ncbi:hypothetical protein N2W54_001215 [Lotmaria passim]